MSRAVFTPAFTYEDLKNDPELVKVFVKKHKEIGITAAAGELNVSPWRVYDALWLSGEQLPPSVKNHYDRRLLPRFVPRQKTIQTSQSGELKCIKCNAQLSHGSGIAHLKKCHPEYKF